MKFEISNVGSSGGFPAVSPESAGIPSEAVIRFLDSVKDCGLNLHGMVIIRGGAVAAEGYWKPYAKDMKHKMASCTKSFTSIAVGFMADEGLLKLSDRVVDYFPELVPPEGVHPYIAATTVRDLLMMSSAHESTTYSRMKSVDWLSSIFLCPPTRLPGTIFAYDTSGTQALCTLVSRLTGKPLLEYLRPRLLNPIGFSKDAYCKTDEVTGIPWGGFGLSCTPLDLAKVAFVCMREGVYDGRQLIPQWYIKEATSRQISNFLERGSPEMQQGYGYQFWRTRNNGFAMLGLGGQAAICLPYKDFVLAVTADDSWQNSHYANLFMALWDYLYPSLSDKPLPQNESKALSERLASLEIPVLAGARTSPAAEKNSSARYVMDENEMGYKAFTFTFGENSGSMLFEKADGAFVIEFGFGGNKAQEFPQTECACIASAEWVGGDTLNIRGYAIGENLNFSLRISACFKEDTLTVMMKKPSEALPFGYNGAMSGRRVV